MAQVHAIFPMIIVSIGAKKRNFRTLKNVSPFDKVGNVALDTALQDLPGQKYDAAIT